MAVHRMCEELLAGIATIPQRLGQLRTASDPLLVLVGQGLFLQPRLVVFEQRLHGLVHVLARRLVAGHFIGPVRHAHATATRRAVAVHRMHLGDEVVVLVSRRVVAREVACGVLRHRRAERVCRVLARILPVGPAEDRLGDGLLFALNAERGFAPVFEVLLVFVAVALAVDVELIDRVFSAFVVSVFFVSLVPFAFATRRAFVPVDDMLLGTRQAVGAVLVGFKYVDELLEIPRLDRTVLDPLLLEQAEASSVVIHETVANGVLQFRLDPITPIGTGGHGLRLGAQFAKIGRKISAPAVVVARRADVVEQLINVDVLVGQLLDLRRALGHGLAEVRQRMHALCFRLAQPAIGDGGSVDQSFDRPRDLLVLAEHTFERRLQLHRRAVAEGAVGELRHVVDQPVETLLGQWRIGLDLLARLRRAEQLVKNSASVLLESLGHFARFR